MNIDFTENAQAGFARETRQPNRAKILRGMAFVAIAICAGIWGSPALALVSGLVFSMVLGHPWPSWSSKLTKWLLQGSVVLLGFGMNFPQIVRLGVRGSVFAALTITVSFVLGRILGKVLRLNKRTSLLVSAGTAICGGSAIAAVSLAIAATEAEIAISIGTIFLLNAAALYLFPMAGHLLDLNQTQFGIWAGIGIHDISSVVGAGLSYGPQALAIATAIKLSRTLWIAPVTLALAIGSGKSKDAPSGEGKGAKVTVPWGVLLFFAASLAGSAVPKIAAVSAVLTGVARHGMVLTLFLVGSSLSITAIRSIGWRAIAAALGLWVAISSLSLVAVKFVPQLAGGM